MGKINNDRSLTLDRLRERLAYDPATGVFTWQVSPNSQVQFGSVAGTVRMDGYRNIDVDGIKYKASRLAWFYVHGEWPDACLDHVNGKRCDDRIDNLRKATFEQNATNKAGTGVSGIKGVFKKYNGTYEAVINYRGKRIGLGTYANIQDAITARKSAALRLQGSFALEARL